MIGENFVNYGTRNGKKFCVVRANDTGSPKFWKNFRINEWTFSLLLFALSLFIVAGKVYVNYGSAVRLSAIVPKSTHSSRVFTGVHEVFSGPNVREASRLQAANLESASERLMNVSRVYGDAIADGVVDMTHKYGWLLRAAFSGIAMMAFTWFIIYKDSSIPGVNPPSPFSPRKKRYQENSRLQMNYLVGVLNGILIFVYMCL